jgi:glycerol-3-phosphate dehydrogenase
MRNATIQALENELLDLLIVGGGIVGSGIARDAAMRGLKVGLVEQHDFAFGTSSRSSRLLHGGMRYLAQGRIGLVRQASVEKKVVHYIAPHLAQPLPFIFPTYDGNRDWILWQLKIGVKIYDLLCGGRNLGKSSWLSPAQALDKVPGLQPTGLRGAVRYYDGFTNDSRLVIDTLRSSARHGARVLNYSRFQEAQRGENWECRLSDELGRNSFTVCARAVVNATGPWANRVQHSRVELRITKGVHLVVDRGRVPVPETVVMTEGKRILFAIPWGERTIIGTTDTDYTGSLDDVRIDDNEINYLLEISDRFFPGAKLTIHDVISGWAGLRPLIADPNGKPSDISRSHQIRNPEPGWWDVAGGKLTTYRLMAEETVDKIVHRLSPVKNGFGPCRTATEPLLPETETEGISGILPPACNRNIVEHFCLAEWAVHLDDVMVRRTGWQHYFRNAQLKSEQVAGWMGEVLGWSAETRVAELERFGAQRPCGTGKSDRLSMREVNA